MTPSRFAAIVLVVYVLLPIRTDLLANVPATSLSGGAFTIEAMMPQNLNTGIKCPVQLVHEQSTQPTDGPEGYALHGQVKCSYFDWFYDTGGLWVSIDGRQNSNHRFGIDILMSGLT